MNPRQPKQLRIAAWNAANLANKKHELIDFLEEHELDMILIGETWLRPGNSVKIPSYTCYRNDRINREGGGTAIYIKKNISHYPLDTPDLINLEATQIITKLHNGTEIKIIAAYNPPQRRLQRFTGKQHHTNSNGRRPKLEAHAVKQQGHNGQTLHQYADEKNCLVDGPEEPKRYSPTGRSGHRNLQRL